MTNIHQTYKIVNDNYQKLKDCAYDGVKCEDYYDKVASANEVIDCARKMWEAVGRLKIEAMTNMPNESQIL